jgi:hypothetical protein
VLAAEAQPTCISPQNRKAGTALARSPSALAIAT